MPSVCLSYEFENKNEDVEVWSLLWSDVSGGRESAALSSAAVRPVLRWLRSQQQGCSKLGIAARRRKYLLPLPRLRSAICARGLVSDDVSVCADFSKYATTTDVCEVGCETGVNLFEGCLTVDRKCNKGF